MCEKTESCGQWTFTSKTTGTDGKEVEKEETKEGCIVNKYCDLAGLTYSGYPVAKYACPSGVNKNDTKLAVSVVAAFALMTQMWEIEIF